MTSENIPSELVFQILTRAPTLEVLDTCKPVCKEWHEMIYESSFMPTFCERTKNVYGYFLQEITYGGCSSMFVSIDHAKEAQNRVGIDNSEGKTRILASCNQGILLCERRIVLKDRYYVCKPTTQQWQALPNPKLRYSTAAVGIIVLNSSPTLRYKIIRISSQEVPNYEPEAVKASRLAKHTRIYKCEIFDSATWSWSTHEDITMPRIEYLRIYQPAVSASNSINWLTTQNSVISFQHSSGNNINIFNKFCLPKPVSENYNFDKELVEYKGKLGITFQSMFKKGTIDLWLMDDYRNNEWTKKLSVSLQNPKRALEPPYLAGFYNADIALMKSCSEVVFYKLRDCSYTTVKPSAGLKKITEAFQFRSDLEPVNLHGQRLP